MTWAFRRQFFYTSILGGFLFIFAFLLIYPYFNKPPTCFDNKQNGTETGVDCGGACTLACYAEVEPISVLWSRSFEVVPGRYNAVAYLLNHNQNTVVKKLSYRFRFADENNIYIGKREGVTYIPSGGKFAVFEGAIDLGYATPVYTTFEFTSTPEWVKVDREKVDQLQVVVSNIKLEGVDTAPSLSATIKNKSLFFIPEVSIIAILYDSLGNAVNVSRTYLDSLAGEEQSELRFTWPEPLSAEVIAKELIPLYDIALVKLR